MPEKIYQFPYIKIQPEAIDLCTRLGVCGVYSPEPQSLMLRSTVLG